MIRFEIIIILLGMLSGTVFSEDLKPDGAYGRFKNPGLFVMEGGDILKLTAFYALDGNVNTAAELSSYNEGSAFAPLELFLLSPLFVNQLSLTTGEGSNQLVTKPRDVMVRAWQTVDGEEKSVYSNQFSLADTLQPQKLDLGQMVKADHWEVQPLAVYLSPEDPLSKYRRAAIAELKLGNNSQVYEIKNLVEAEKTFLDGYIQNRVHEFQQTFGVLREVELTQAPENLATRWKGLGVEIEKIKPAREKPFRLYLQFALESSNSGPILTLPAGSYPFADADGAPVLMNTNRIGEWKMDINGNLNIKLGNGDWKQQAGKLDWFGGTDLEGAGNVYKAGF